MTNWHPRPRYRTPGAVCFALAVVLLCLLLWDMGRVEVPPVESVDMAAVYQAAQERAAESIK